MGVRLLVRTDLRNDKDKRSLRLSQEVRQKKFFCEIPFLLLGHCNYQ
jgi:hypothetical protein